MKEKNVNTIEEIIDRISSIRYKKKKSARELSLSIGKNAGYIHMLETNKNFAPTIETLLDILDEFEMPLEHFFYHDLEQYEKDKEILNLLKDVKNDKVKASIICILNEYKNKD